MNIKLSFAYICAFLFLTMLCGLSHEMVHHISAALVCGCWGYKTFNSFSVCSTCANPDYTYWATIAGPVFTFALIWLGWYQLTKEDARRKQLGFALIFANFPINRMLFVFLGSNDEQYIAKTLFGKSTLVNALTIILVMFCTLPPLITAYKAIKNKRKILWFLGFYLLPFVFVVLFAGLFLENFLLLKHQILANTAFGIPYLLILTEVICIIGYAFTKKYLTIQNFNES